MKKILINSPKGGVGKTTLATNIALLLALRGKKVLALDLAQGSQMAKDLNERDEFKKDKSHIVVDEAGGIPDKIKGEKKFDYVVADTDDSFHVIGEIADSKVSSEWSVIVPIVNDRNGLERIPRELGHVMKGSMFLGNKINIRIVGNRICEEKDREKIKRVLTENNLSELLSSFEIKESQSEAPFFVLEDEEFESSLESILEEMGLVQ